MSSKDDTDFCRTIVEEMRADGRRWTTQAESDEKWFPLQFAGVLAFVTVYPIAMIVGAVVVLRALGFGR